MDTPSFRKILTPVDFSPSSRLAFDYALLLADKFKGVVHVVHAWEVPTYLRPDLTVWAGEVSATLAEHAKTEAEKGLRAFMEQVGAAGLRNVTSQVIGGPPYSVIVSTAADGAYDLIAMGTHGRVGLPHLVLGSVAEKVVRHAKCPVLTVRAPKS